MQENGSPCGGNVCYQESNQSPECTISETIHHTDHYFYYSKKAESHVPFTISSYSYRAPGGSVGLSWAHSEESRVVVVVFLLFFRIIYTNFREYFDSHFFKTTDREKHDLEEEVSYGTSVTAVPPSRASSTVTSRARSGISGTSCTHENRRLYSPCVFTCTSSSGKVA